MPGLTSGGLQDRRTAEFELPVAAPQVQRLWSIAAGRFCQLKCRSSGPGNSVMLPQDLAQCGNGVRRKEARLAWGLVHAIERKFLACAHW
jgi:hypothetical protein